MSAGTISIQNNAAAVAGTGTAFTTELSAGDFIVITTGGVTYTLPVKSIESDTALTLARSYNGPAVTGAAWTAMPRDTLNRISAQIAADTAYAIRQRVLEIDNWYQLLEVNGDVTIKMADGSSYTGPSWPKLIDAMNNPTWALAKSKNLSDLEDRDEAWMNVRPDGPTPLAADPVNDDHAATKGWVEKFITSVRSVLASWSVINGGAAVPANGTSVKGGKIRSVYQVAGAEYAAAELQTSVATSSTGARTVSAEIVVNDSTGGNTASKTIKLGTVDGLTGGVISGPSVHISPPNVTGNGGSSDPNNGFMIVDTNYGQNPTGLPIGGQYWARTLVNGVLKWQFGFYQETFIGVRSSGVLSIRNEEAGVSGNFRFDDGGNAYALNGSWINGGSSARIKENFEEIKDPLSTMRKIRACTWTLKTKSDKGKFGIGVLAEGLYEDYPEAKITVGDLEMADGTVEKDVESVQAGDSGVLAAVHHESILQLMDIVKEAITMIAGVTTDESAKAALEALAEKIPASE